MFEEWCGFFKEFINALPLPTERKNEHHLNDVRTPLYTLSHSGFQEMNSDILEEELVLDDSHPRDDFD